MQLPIITRRAAPEGLLDQPALLPPAGDVANFTDPPNLNDLVIAVTIICMVLVTVVLLLRLIPRISLRKKVTIDNCMSKRPGNLSIVRI